jgi:hypothetical protein
MQRFVGFQSVLGVTGAVLLAACGGGSSRLPRSPATHLFVAAPASANAGTAFNVTLIALDASNNMVTTYSGIVHITSTDPQAVLPANSAGERHRDSLGHADERRAPNHHRDRHGRSFDHRHSERDQDPRGDVRIPEHWTDGNRAPVPHGNVTQ